MNTECCLDNLYIQTKITKAKNTHPPKTSNINKQNQLKKITLKQLDQPQNLKDLTN